MSVPNNMEACSSFSKNISSTLSLTLPLYQIQVNSRVTWPFFFFHPSQICTIMRCRAVAHFFKDLVSKVAWPKIVDPKTRLYILKGQNTKQPEPIYILRAWCMQCTPFRVLFNGDNCNQLSHASHLRLGAIRISGPIMATAKANRKPLKTMVWDKQKQYRKVPTCARHSLNKDWTCAHIRENPNKGGPDKKGDFSILLHAGPINGLISDQF